MIKKQIALALSAVIFISVAHAEENFGTVNGEPITEEEVSATIGQTGMSYSTLDPEMKKRVIEMVVDRKLLTQAAMKSGIEKTQAYQAQLKSLKQDLALDAWMRKEMKMLEDSFTKEKLQAEYKKNEAKYSMPKQLHARHILVDKEADAKALIKELDAAKDKKAKFIELAKSKSTGPSGKDGGDLGWFELSRMVPEFSAAADALKEGAYTKTPVKTQFGYHLIFLDGRKDAMLKPFEAVEKAIRTEMSGQAFAEKMKAKTAELRKSAKIDLKK